MLSEFVHIPHEPAISDTLLPNARLALDANLMQKLLTEHFAIGALQSIALIRHKKGRRCVIAYGLLDSDRQPQVWIAKVRAKGVDRRTFALCQRLWLNGFDSNASDQISIPEPIGCIDSLGMTIQRAVRGQTILNAQSQIDVNQIAAAIGKLHTCGVETDRHFSVDDELSLLSARYEKLILELPTYKPRLSSLLETVKRRLTQHQSPIALLHRDFYHDQVLIDGSRTWILDLDLCAQGPASLDVGNFSAHLIELSIRAPQERSALLSAAESLTLGYHRSNTSVSIESIQAFTLATLARHVSLCRQFPERAAFFDAILDAAESLANQT